MRELLLNLLAELWQDEDRTEPNRRETMAEELLRIGEMVFRKERGTVYYVQYTTMSTLNSPFLPFEGKAFMDHNGNLQLQKGVITREVATTDGDLESALDQIENVTRTELKKRFFGQD